MGDDSEWMKLPTDDKIQHKVWKARVAGYEEATKLFGSLPDERSPEFSKYLGLIKKMVVDSNAIAQEKALDAVLAYVENAAVAGKTAGETCGGVITKCLNSSRAKTKEKGIEILMMYIEIEKQEIVQEELLKGLSNKQPKVVIGCIQALRQALSEFGMKTIPIKPMVKQLSRLLEDRDKGVREETKLLAIEIYRWIGQALKPQLANFKPVQVQELEAEFEKLPPGKPQQTRFLRSQQDLKAKMEQAAVAGEEDEEGGAEEEDAEMDPYELMSAVDVLSKLPKDYYEKIEAKKWQERREALEAVEKLVQAPKLESGDYGALVRTLQKVLAKDTNVMLVALAGKVLLGLATGLRQKFTTYAVSCIETILDKFKEKKATVVSVLREAIDACAKHLSLEPISEQCVAALENKNPSIKAETASFLARCFSRCTMATLPKKLLKMFVAQLLKTINDTAPDVREASFQALGTAMKVVGEKPLIPLLADVDSIKMAKIKECCEKAVVTGKGGKAPASAGGAPAATAGAPAKKEAAAAKEAPKSIRGGGGSDKKVTEKASEANPPLAQARAAAKPASGKGAAGGKKAAATKGKKGKAAAAEANTEPMLSDDAVEEKVAALLPPDIPTGLASSNWKERLAAMERMLDAVRSMSRTDINCQAFVRLVARKPGLKETNFQVLKLKVELIGRMATNANFSRTSAECCLTELVDKIGDVKNGSTVQETLSCMAEACSLEFVSQQVIAAAFEQKNPKNQSEALNWLAQAIREFGFKVNIKPMLQYIKKAFAATNPAVRTAAITLVGVMYMYMGQALRVFFDGEKPALLQQIDAEFTKVSGERPPAPTRGMNNTGGEEGEGEDGEEEEEASGEDAINVADLVPRNNISASITPELLAAMADKNWKIRAEALQKLISILNEAKFITPQVGGLPEALKARLGDSNKILVNTTVTICQTFATAMGPKVKQHVAVIGPGLIGVFGDSKPQVRAAAVAAANVWVEQCGLLPFVEAEIFSDALKDPNPNLRSELLGWLAEKLPSVKKLPAELNMCTPHIFSCLEDRNASVRQKAQDVLMPYMIHIGYESMARQASKLKPSSKDMVMGHLEKAKLALPAKPVKTKPVAKVAPKMANKPAPKVPSPEPDADDELEMAPTKEPVKTVKGGRGRTAVLGKKGAATSSKKKEEDVDTSPPLRVSNGKEQRQKDEKNLKVLKWNFTTPRGEFVDQLRAQMEPTFNKTLMEQLFHSDFKMQIKAIDTFNRVVESDPEAIIANLDLILRWVSLRFFETNTSVLLKNLEFLQQLFTVLAENDYHMIEFEAAAFIPYLINKVGDPKDNVRRDIRTICKLICKVYPYSKLFAYILEGLKTKNTKQKMECLEELGNLIETYGMTVCQPTPSVALKLIASHIASRDNSVRSAALNTIVAAYAILGESVYKHIGKLSDKDQGMLEERIKRSAKSRPVTAPAAPAEEKPVRSGLVRPSTANSAQSIRSQNVNNALNNAAQSEDRPEPRHDLLDLGEFRCSKEDFEMPQLIEQDIDDILNEPFELPKIRYRAMTPSSKLVNNDAKSTIDFVISQIGSSDVTTSIQALTQIDQLLMDQEKAELLTPHLDQYLVVCVQQLRLTYSRQVANDGTDTRDIIRVYRCVLGSVLTVFQSNRRASSSVLRDLFHMLITILLEQSLGKMEDGPQIVRSVNMLVVNILQKSEKTAVMSAVMRLLHESIAMETCPAQFIELIMKCLWKLTRMLPDIINELNIDRLLLELDNFLKAFPVQKGRPAGSDMPQRTVRTILHTLAKQMGNEVLNHLSLIEQPNSEAEQYLRKVLKNTAGKESLSNNAKNDAMNGNDENITSNQSRDPPRSTRRLSKSTHDMLADIFKKIGSKENTREGLHDLYEFKKNYPDADLDPFLKKSSQFFQNYITQGLRTIEHVGPLESVSSNRSATSGRADTASASRNTATSRVGDGPAVDMSAIRSRYDSMRERFREAGIPMVDPMPSVNTTATIQGESTSSSLSSSSSSGIVPIDFSSDAPEQAKEEPTKSSVNLVDLRRRLEKVRKGITSQNS